MRNVIESVICVSLFYLGNILRYSHVSSQSLILLLEFKNVNSR